MKINNQQLRHIHLLLRQANLESQKQSLVAGFSNARETSSKELLYNEADALIKYLQTQVKPSNLNAEAEGANKMRRKIISICYSLNWRNADETINMKSINEFCKTKGYLKKELKEYTYNELPKLVSQFQQVYKRFINNHK